MSALTITFHGSYLEGLAWLSVCFIWSGAMYFFGWLQRDHKAFAEQCAREDAEWGFKEDA